MTEPARKTWGVVVIHGVGDTEPGASVGALLTSMLPARQTLKEDAPPAEWQLVEPPIRLPRPDALQPPDPSRESLLGKGTRFPAHVRTFANSAPGQPGRAVFAEVFWADLSRSGSGRLDVLRRVIGLIFDLRHVSDVASAYPLPVARTLRLALYAVSWLLCGPIAGLTAFVLALLLARYGAVSLHDFFVKVPPSARAGELAVLAFSVVAGAGWWWFARWRKRSSWAADGAWMLFSGWVIVAAAITALVAAVRLWSNDQFPWDGWLGRLLVQRLILNESPDSVLATHLVVLLGVTYVAFTAIALGSVASALLWLAARVQIFMGRPREAAPALDAALGVSLLQVLLWVVLGAAIATVVLDRFVPQHDELFDTVALGFVLGIGIAVTIGLCAFAVWLRRTLWVRARKWDPPDAIPRLLLNTLILVALIGLSLASVIVFAWAFITGDLRLYHELKFLAPYAKPVGAGLALVLGVPFLFKGVRAALHILVDITSHFYRPRPQPLGELHPGEFTIQQRIEGRVRRVIQQVLASGDVTHLTIVAHSQGTVIALDVLWLEWTRNLLAGRAVDLVTMGSPISHLYQHYFPHRYPALFLADGKLNPDWGESLDVTVRQWHNIYRVDDYIGTVVRGRPGFPENQLMAKPGGHTGYWGDEEVRDLMLRTGVFPG